MLRPVESGIPAVKYIAEGFDEGVKAKPATMRGIRRLLEAIHEGADAALKA